jgi:predicted phosphodiesterase
LRLHILSDLHLEFGPFPYESPDADVIVLAGDIALQANGLAWAAGARAGRPVVYVPGNHEYYGASIPRLTEKLKAAGRAYGIHVLDREVVEIQGLPFLGTTLWTDFELFGDRAAGMAAAQNAVTDYRRIRVSPSFRRLRPLDTAGMHLGSRRWLQREIAAGTTRHAIIVTHHAPSRLSLSSQELSDPLSSSDASNLDHLVQESGAALWVHGHTHHCVDYSIGTTRVVSNQRGYADEPVAGFHPGFVLDVVGGSVLDTVTGG